MNKDQWKGCGISWLWGLRSDHPFKDACKLHDARYDDPQGLSPRAVDKLFLRDMQSVAKGPWQQVQAKLFYGLARAWRLVR